MTNAEQIVEQRESTHGDYATQTFITESIKDVMRPFLVGKPPWLRHTFDMIATKIGRALAGNYKEVDHYDDIGGYALCAKEQVLKETAPGHKLKELTNVVK